MRRYLCLLLLVVSACVSPRVSTEKERADANLALSLAEKGLNIALVLGKVSQPDHAHALQEIRDLRLLVEDSATQPMGISDLVIRATNVAERWVIYTVEKKLP